MSKVKLGDVAVECRETCKGSKDGYPIVGLEHLVPGEVTLTAWDEAGDTTFNKMFRKGSVLFGRRRAYLRKAAVAPFDGICSSDITVIKANQDRLVPELLPFIIQNDGLFDFAVGKSAGSLSPRVKWEHLKNYEFELPDDMAKQQELAELLWAIDATKKSYQRLISATDELVKSQFIEMFGNISSGKYKYPTKKLGDVADVKSSHRIFTKEFVDSGVPFYRGTEIGQLAKGQIPTDLYYISNERYKEIASDDSKPQKGDLLMPSICDKGQVWLVDTDEPFYYKDGRVLCISPNRSTCNSKFLQYFIKQKTEIEYPKLGPGSTFAEFKIFLLKDMDILIPPITEQQNFASFVEQSDKSKFELKKALSELTATYKRIIKENIG